MAVRSRARDGGSALRAEIVLCLRGAKFVGDDITDEDVFRIDQPHRLVGARAGTSEDSAARFYLEDQSQIEALLALLIELRRPEFRAS